MLSISPSNLFKLITIAFGTWSLAAAQSGHPVPPPPPSTAKATKCSGRPVPQLEDITAAAGITFRHTSDPSKRYIVESMSGGVILIDYDRDGWPDIYFTNAPTVEMAIKGEKSFGVLYHNNHDGTFSDVTAKIRPINSPASRWAAQWATTTTMAGPISISLASVETSSIATTAMVLSQMSRRKPALRTDAGRLAQRSATTTATDLWT